MGEAGAVGWSDVHLPWRRLCRHQMEVESESDLCFSFLKSESDQYFLFLKSESDLCFSFWKSESRAQRTTVIKTGSPQK